MNNTKQKGFTLIEMLVVVLIIGILTSIGWPEYKKSIEKARYSELQQLVEQLNDAEEMYFQEYGEYTDDFGKLKDFRLSGQWQIVAGTHPTDASGTQGIVQGGKYQKKDGSLVLSLETVAGYHTGEAIFGQLRKGGGWTNSYYIYLPNAGWRQSVRECRANVDDGEKNNPRNVYNHVCDSVGGIRCQWNSSNRNIFIIESVNSRVDGTSNVDNILNKVCAVYKDTPSGITKGYYKGKKWFQGTSAALN